MSTPADVATLRINVNEPTDALPWTDAVLGALVDEFGSVDAASAEVWTRKAAGLAELVNTTEAGASYAFGDLYKNAIAMSKVFASRAGVSATGGSAGVRVSKIVRS